MKKFLFLILVIFLLPLSIKATDDTVLTMNCPAGGTKNSTLTCSLKISSDVVINEVSVEYDFNGNFTYLSFTPQSNFEVVSYSSTGFKIKSERGSTGEFVIGNISFKILNAGFWGLKNIKIKDMDGNIYKADKLGKDLKILSEDNTLKSLIVSSGTLSPAFQPSITSYKLEVDVKTVVFTAVANDPNAAVASPVKADLSYGENTINLVVTSESGSKKTYKIVITRKDDRSDNSKLKSLTILGEKIDISKDSSNYSIVLKEEVSKINIEAELADSKSSFVEGYGPREITFKEPKTVAEIKVMAENKSIRTYTFTFVRQSDDLSGNNKIKSLKIEGHNINFKSDVYSYDIHINKEEALKFEVELEDQNASYELVNSSLKDGNYVIIRVTAENGDTRDYKVNIILEGESETTKSVDFNDLMCSDNSLIYYLISFFLGVFLTTLIAVLVVRRKEKKAKKIEQAAKTMRPTQVTGNTEVLDFNKEDML